MSLMERAYSVLVVSAAAGFNTALSEMLPESRYSSVQNTSAIAAAKRKLAEREYDFIIINSPLPDDTGIRFAIDACTSGSSVVLLLTKADIYQEIYERVAEYGVFTLAKPLSRTVLVTALDWMSSARERLRRNEKKTLSIEAKMEEIRIVNRAKWLLIGELSMSEPEAHRYIEKQAMDRCVAKTLVAEEIIKTYT